MEQPQPKMSNFQQRVLAGVIGGAVFIGAIWFSEWTFFALFLALTVLGLLEFYRLVAGIGSEPNHNLGVLLAAGFSAGIYCRNVAKKDNSFYQYRAYVAGGWICGGAVQYAQFTGLFWRRIPVADHFRHYVPHLDGRFGRLICRQNLWAHQTVGTDFAG